MATKTDDAFALEALRIALNAIKFNAGTNTPKTSAERVAILFETEVDSDEFWLAVSMIRSRISALISFYQVIESEELRDRNKALIIKQLKSFSRQFSIQLLNAPITQTQSRIIPDSMLDHPIGNSSFLRKHRLKVMLDEDEKSQCLELLESYEINTSTSDGAIILLTDSIAKLKFSIKYMQWFGAEPILEQLMTLDYIANNWNDNTAGASTATRGKKNKPKLIKLIADISTIIFFAPSLDSSLDYYQQSPPVIWVVEQLSKEYKDKAKLPAPIKPLAIQDQSKGLREEE